MLPEDACKTIKINQFKAPPQKNCFLSEKIILIESKQKSKPISLLKQIFTVIIVQNLWVVKIYYRKKGKSFHFDYLWVYFFSYFLTSKAEKLLMLYIFIYLVFTLIFHFIYSSFFQKNKLLFNNIFSLSFSHYFSCSSCLTWKLLTQNEKNILHSQKAVKSW